MKILWVCRTIANHGGGDAIFDAKLIAGLRAAHVVDVVDVGKNRLPVRLQRMLLERVPPDRAGFGGRADVVELSGRLSVGGYDALVISHEHLDYLVARLAGPARQAGTRLYVVHHNVTSSLMRGVLKPPFGSLVELGYRAYERSTLASPDIRRVFMLSHADARLVQDMTQRHDIGIVLPGAPPAVALADNAEVARELLMLGTYDWFPKRWSLQRFVHEWSQLAEPPAPVLADAGLPEQASAVLGARSSAAIDLSVAIRFGVLTDRFKAGHKLKTAAYLMSNCVVLSFADVLDDFRFSPHAELFIRKVDHVEAIGPVMREFAAMPVTSLRERLREFKAAIVQQLAWDRQVAVLETALREDAQH